jgi:hypothetical protein
MRAILMLPILLAVAPAAAQQAVFPEAFPPDRYQEMMAESPFALATPPVKVEAPKDSFTKEWVLAGLSKVRDEQGVERDFVAIKSRDSTEQFALFGTDPDKERGVSIASVERSPQVGKSKVTLKKGNEFGVVEFNQMEVEASIAAPPAGNQRPGGAPAGIRPPTNNGRPQIPRPGGLPQSGGTITNPSAAQPQFNNTNAGIPLPGAANPPTSAADTRKRIRVINSKQ